MSFGTCCIKRDESDYRPMEAKSVEIKGEQRGLLVNFELIQTFVQNNSRPQEAYYLFPNDLKMCIYDTTFAIGDEVIKPKLEPKDEAKKTYEEAVRRGHTALYGSNIENGLTEFKLGNVPPDTICKVILKVAFTCNVTEKNLFFIKFPLDVYDPCGSRECLDMHSSNFYFQLKCDTEKVKNVHSNVLNGHYDEKQKIFTINDRVKCRENEKSIIVNFETIEPIQSSVFVGETMNDYDNCAVTISPHLEEKQSDSEKEFVFLIDCSGSMSGSSIKKAAECLEVFIRSLPVNSYFNVVRFGSDYHKLFDNSVKYDEQNIQTALKLAKNLDADLGGTEIFRPLENIYKEKNKFGQRQIFIMTDGEVWDVEKVLKLVSSHSNDNRCFTIGIGRGCDAGLVEGIAKSSAGKCDFVQEGDSIAEKVIPQLQSSLYGSVDSIEIHIEGEENDAFQTSPFPIPSINPKSSSVIYLRSKKSQNESKFNKNFLVTANFADENIEIPIADINRSQNYQEDKFGCSEGKNIGKAILPLFAFNLLQKYEKEENLSEADKKNAIELSLSSGVLCKFTGLVGISKNIICRNRYEIDDYTVGCCIPCIGSCMKECCKCDLDFDDDNECCMKCCMNEECNDFDDDEKYCMNEECNDSDDDEECDICLNERIEMAEEQKQSNNEDKGFDLMLIMRLQNFNGYWDDLNALNKMLNLNINHINGVNASDKEIEKNCVATLIAIAALHKNAGDERNVWIMIEQKAIKWLKKVLPNADIDQLINETKALF